MSKKSKYKSPLQATLNGIIDLYKHKTVSVKLPNPLNLKGKNIMIIGASSGLGFAAAQKIASAGAKLIMAMRSGIPAKGDKIKDLSGNQQVAMYHVDLLDFKSINNFVENLIKDNIKLDIIISNAAMVPLRSRKSPDGLEEMFMVNYLSAFYLLNQLVTRNLIKLNESFASKIIIVSSESHRDPANFNWDNFGKYESYGIKETVARYAYFKLLLTTFANALSHRIKESNLSIMVQVLCPGPVNSNIAREAPGYLQPLLKVVFSIFFKSPNKACEPILYFASKEDQAPLNIEYLFLMQPKEMAEKSLDNENGHKLWRLSEDLIRSLGYDFKSILSTNSLSAR